MCPFTVRQTADIVQLNPLIKLAAGINTVVAPRDGSNGPMPDIRCRRGAATMIAVNIHNGPCHGKTRRRPQPGNLSLLHANARETERATMGRRSDNPANGPVGRFQAWFFGPFRVLRDGTEIADPAWGRRTSTRTLLKWFLLNPGQSFSTAELCEVLWSGSGGTKKVNDLHVTLHGLRRVLEPGLSGRSPSRFIHTDSGRYRFDPADRWWTDVEETRRLWTSALGSRDSGAHAAAIASLDRLLDYYSQGFLPEEFYADAFAGFRDIQEQGHDEALRVLLGLYRDTGRRFEVLTCAQRILDRNPYSEFAVTALVEVHLEQGNPATAIAELNRFARIQEDDLGVRPSPHLLCLRDRVRRSSGRHPGGL